MKIMLFKVKLPLFPVDLENFWNEKILAKFPRNWGGSRRIGARKMGGVLYKLKRVNLNSFMPMQGILGIPEFTRSPGITQCLRDFTFIPKTA